MPYEYVLRSSKGRELVALGVFHSKPPIERLVALWDGFLKHEGEMVAMAEGRLRPVPTSLEEAVARRGEVDAVQWLAHRDGVEAVFPEPSNTELITALKENFNSEDVAFSTIASRMSSRERTLPGLSADEALKQIIEEHAKNSGVYGFTPTLEWFWGKFKSAFGEQSIDDRKFWSSIYDPFSDETIFNRISAQRSRLRDLGILNTIVKYWNEGRNIFFVYGHAHVVRLEPALRALVAPIPNLSRRLTRLPR